MNKKILICLMIFMMMSLFLYGCKKKDEETEPVIDDKPQEPEVIKNYVKGDLVKISGTEWYVLEDCPEKQESIKLMSRYDINPLVLTDNTCDELFYTPDVAANNEIMPFDMDDSNRYENSETRKLMEGDLKDIIERILNIKVLSIGLWDYKVFEDLGCKVEVNDSEEVSAIDCSSTDYYKVFANGYYTWTIIPSARKSGGSAMVWIVGNDGTFYEVVPEGFADYSIRPVIEVDKSSIDK